MQSCGCLAFELATQELLGPKLRLTWIWGTQSRACQRHLRGCVYWQSPVEVKLEGAWVAGGRVLGEQGVETETQPPEADTWSSNEEGGGDLGQPAGGPGKGRQGQRSSSHQLLPLTSCNSDKGDMAHRG